jgi:hypothetical protein
MPGVAEALRRATFSAERLAPDLAGLRAAVAVAHYRAALWCEAGRLARERARTMRLGATVTPGCRAVELARVEQEITEAESCLDRQRWIVEELAVAGDRADAATIEMLAVVMHWAVEGMRDEAAELRNRVPVPEEPAAGG